MSIHELGVRPADKRPLFAEHILALPDLPRDDSAAMKCVMRLILTAAHLGRRSLDSLVFAGLDGDSVITDGTFGVHNEADIEGMTYREWCILANSGSSEGQPFGTPPEEALLNTKMPTVVALDKDCLAESEQPDGLFWYLVKPLGSPKTRQPSFDDAVVSAVYIPDTVEEVITLQKRLGIPSSHIYDGVTERYGRPQLGFLPAPDDRQTVGSGGAPHLRLVR